MGVGSIMCHTQGHTGRVAVEEVGIFLCYIQTDLFFFNLELLGSAEGQSVAKESRVLGVERGAPKWK